MHALNITLGRLSQTAELSIIPTFVGIDSTHLELYLLVNHWSPMESDQCAMTSSDDKDPLLGDFLLRRIGNDLDREYYPVVYRGGTVGPGASIPSSSSGNEVLISERRKNRARGTTRPESGQGPWATARNPDRKSVV